MSDKISFSEEVWKTLSCINVQDHVEEKMNLSYLSWAWAWAELMNHYPQSFYVFYETVYFNDGTAEVWVDLTIQEGEKKLIRSMWLPVMNHKNQSIVSPNSRAISDTRMRCLVKAMAMVGLGHNIYAGEDLPTGIAYTNEGDKYQFIADTILSGIADDDVYKVGETWAETTEEEKKILWTAKTKGGYFTQDEKTYIRDAIKVWHEEGEAA